MGAIGAVLGHFSIRQEPALISMPTGTGKTAVMTALCFVLRANKVLVVTPSHLVRNQITEEFETLDVLRKNNLLAPDSPAPRVYQLKQIIDTPAQWQEILAGHDVIVAIPGTLHKIEDLVGTLPAEAFDLVLVDEAHHSRADSWSFILAHFAAAKHVLLTATAFRSDKKDIKARLVYNYRLKQAYEDGLFSRIEYVPVETAQLASLAEKDTAIAQVTSQLHERQRQHGHKIIIRTDSKSRAHELKKIYDATTPLKLEVIESKYTNATIDRKIKLLNQGHLDGIICVNMMGEGYNFPALKIAAIHAPHKSLAITLQFIGRIARTNTAQAGVAWVVAGKHDFAIESEQLFKEDKDWSSVLPDLHATVTDATEASQAFLDTFEIATVADPSYVAQTEEAVSIDNADLRPFFHAKLFQITLAPTRQPLAPDGVDVVDVQLVDIDHKIDFTAIAGLSQVVLRHHFVSHDYQTAVYVVAELIQPAWYATDDNLKDIRHSLIIVYYDTQSSILCICSSLKDNDLYEKIAAAFVKPTAFHEPISLPRLKRILAGWENPKFYNIGMRSRKARGSSESYRNILGSVAQNSLNATDAFNYTRGHSFGEAFDSVLGKNMLLGISTGSKVWSIHDGKIDALLEWLLSLITKVANPAMDALYSPLGELDCGKDIARFPISASNPLLLADWDGPLYERESQVVFLDAEGKVVEQSQSLLVSCALRIMRDDCTPERLVFEVRKHSLSAKLHYRITPQVEYTYADDTLHTIAFLTGNNVNRKRNFLLDLRSHPVTFYFENLSKLVGRTLMSFNPSDISTFDAANLCAVNWLGADVNVHREFYSADDLLLNQATLDDRLSIHDYIIEIAKASYDVVYYDHDSLEIADVIAIKPGGIKFYHCKKQSGVEPQCSIEDIYEVCGQAVKSTIWTNKKLLLKQLVDRNKGQQTGGRVKQGTLDQAAAILSGLNHPTLPIEIVIVHPGLKSMNHRGTQRAAFERISLLFSGAESYMSSISRSTLSVMCS